MIYLFFLFIIVNGYEPFYEQTQCENYGDNCRECVRYVENFEEKRRGCEWCEMPNYFDSYCFNPNTTVCKGKIQEICQMDPFVVSIAFGLCILPLVIIILILIFSLCIKKFKKLQTKEE